MGRVVVGVDGSERSKRALRRGVEEASLRGRVLEAVYVYPPAHRSLSEGLGGLPSSMSAGHSEASRSGDPHDEARQAAYDELEVVVMDALGGSPAVSPRLVVIPHDEVAEALADHSAGAELLVIGMRRRSPVGKLVLGSDARDTILQARTAVLAIKDEDDGWGA